MATYAAWRLEGREVTYGPSDLRDVLNWLGEQPYISGPNGPLTERLLFVDGRRTSVWDACRASGLVPLVRSHLSTEVFAGVEPA